MKKYLLTFLCLLTFFIVRPQGITQHANETAPDLSTNNDANAQLDQKISGSLLLNDIIYINIDRSTYSDETILRMYPGATYGFDPAFDATKMLSSNDSIPQVYTYSSNQDKLAINSIPDTLTVPQVVPMGVVSYSTDQLKFSANFTNFNPAVQVILEDIQLNVLQDLKVQADYYYIPLATEENSRFLLHFNPFITGLENSSSDETLIYTFSNTLYINQNDKNATVHIYNMLGQQVYKTHIITSGLTKLDLSLAPAQYIVQLISKGKSKVEKVFIK